MNTQIAIDFKAVSHARFYYKSQLGLIRRTLPKLPTANGMTILPGMPALNIHDYPFETMMERCRRLGIIDVWTPYCVLQLRNNHALTFKGEKAKEMWANYRAHLFKKK